MQQQSRFSSPWIPALYDASGNVVRYKASEGLSPLGIMQRSGGATPYKGGSSVRRASALWNTSSGSADSDFLPNQEVIRSRSRSTARNNPLAAGAIRTTLDNAIGKGLRCRSRVDHEFLGITPESAKRIERNFDRVFFMWSKTPACDVTHMQSFGGLQRLALQSMLESGDTMVMLPFVPQGQARFPLSTKVQLVEADRVSNPNKEFNRPDLVGGVQMDVWGAPQYYWVMEGHPGDTMNAASMFRAMNWKKVRAYTSFPALTYDRQNAWLMFERSRPGQTRGVPYFAVVLEQLHQIERYTDASLMAAVVGGMFTVFITSPEGDMPPLPVASLPFGAQTQEYVQANRARSLTDMALDYGLILPLAEGEDVKFADPKQPNDKFAGFIEANLKQAGPGIGLPYEVFTKHFASSYSASRGAVLEAWKFFTYVRCLVVEYFCQPAYETVIAEALLRGFVQAPGFFDDPLTRMAYLGTEWFGPAMGQMDPTKEIEAAARRLQAGVSTYARETVELTGEDWEDTINKRKKEQDMLKELELEDVLSLSGKPNPPEPQTPQDEGAGGGAPSEY